MNNPAPRSHKTSLFYPRLFGLSYSCLVLALALFAIARALLINTYGAESFSWQELSPVFQRGARFDAKTAILLLFLPLLLSLLFGFIASWRNWLLRLYKSYLTLLLVASTLLALINHFYYRNFQNHIDIFVFGLFEDDVSAIFATIWQDYPWLWFLLLFFILSLSLAWLLPRLAKYLHYWPESRWLRLSYCSGIILLLLILGRGSLGIFPLSTDTHLAVSPHNFLNRAVVNGVYALYDAFENRYSSSRPAKVDRDQASAAWQQLKKLQPETYHGELPSADQLFWRSGSNSKLNWQQPPHVVLVLRESFGSQLLNFHTKDNDLMGALQPHWETDLIFDNFVSATLGTHSSLEKILLSLPMSDVTLSELRKLAFPSSLARFYQQQGYQSSYVTGGNKNWHDLDLLLPEQGFANLYDQIDIAAKLSQVEYDGNWGVFDQYAYDFILRLLENAEQPQFIFLLTTSNHSPYSVPSDYRLPRPQLSQQLQALAFERPVAELEKVLHAYQYANDAFGNFISAIKVNPDTKANTIIAATGDHHARDIIRYDADPELMAFRHMVPLYLYLPRAARARVTYQPTRVGSHWDIAATLIATSHPNNRHFAFGHNLLGANMPDNMVARAGNFYLHAQGAIASGQHYQWSDKAQKRLRASVDPVPELQQAQQWAQARYLLLQYWFGEFITQ